MDGILLDVNQLDATFLTDIESTKDSISLVKNLLNDFLSSVPSDFSGRATITSYETKINDIDTYIKDGKELVENRLQQIHSIEKNKNSLDLSTFADGYFEESKWYDNFSTRTAATGANLVIGFGKGLLSFGEALLDTGAMIVGGAISLVAGIGEGIFTGDWSFSSAKSIWKDTKALTSTNYVNKLSDTFYNSKAGKWLDNNAYSWGKSDGIGCQISQGLGYMTGVVLTGGAVGGFAGVSTVVSTSMVAATAGVGKYTTEEWNKNTININGSNGTDSLTVDYDKFREIQKLDAGQSTVINREYYDENGNKKVQQYSVVSNGDGTYSMADAYGNSYTIDKDGGMVESNDLKGLGIGTIKGVWEGLQYGIGMKIGTAEFTKMTGSIANPILKKVAVSGTRVGLDSLTGAAEVPFQSGVDSLFNNKSYSQAWNDAGGWEAVGSQTLIAGIGSTVGETGVVQKTGQYVGKNIRNLWDSITGDSKTIKIGPASTTATRKEISSAIDGVIGDTPTTRTTGVEISTKSEVSVKPDAKATDTVAKTTDNVVGVDKTSRKTFKEQVNSFFDKFKKKPASVDESVSSKLKGDLAENNKSLDSIKEDVNVTSKEDVKTTTDVEKKIEPVKNTDDIKAIDPTDAKKQLTDAQNARTEAQKQLENAKVAEKTALDSGNRSEINAAKINRQTAEIQLRQAEYRVEDATYQQRLSDGTANDGVVKSYKEMVKARNELITKLTPGLSKEAAAREMLQGIGNRNAYNDALDNYHKALEVPVNSTVETPIVKPIEVETSIGSGSTDSVISGVPPVNTSSVKGLDKINIDSTTSGVVAATTGAFGLGSFAKSFNPEINAGQLDNIVAEINKVNPGVSNRGMEALRKYAETGDISNISRVGDARQVVEGIGKDGVERYLLDDDIVKANNKLDIAKRNLSSAKDNFEKVRTETDAELLKAKKDYIDNPDKRLNSPNRDKSIQEYQDRVSAINKKRNDAELKVKETENSVKDVELEIEKLEAKKVELDEKISKKVVTDTRAEVETNGLHGEKENVSVVSEISKSDGEFPEYIEGTRVDYSEEGLRASDEALANNRETLAAFEERLKEEPPTKDTVDTINALKEEIAIEEKVNSAIRNKLSSDGKVSEVELDSAVVNAENVAVNSDVNAKTLDEAQQRFDVAQKKHSEIAEKYNEELKKYIDGGKKGTPPKTDELNAAYREMEEAGDALDIEKAKIFREKFNNRVNDNPESVVKEISKADKERIIDMVQRKETINETLSSDDLDNIEAIKTMINNKHGDLNGDAAIDAFRRYLNGEEMPRATDAYGMNTKATDSVAARMAKWDSPEQARAKIEAYLKDYDLKEIADKSERHIYESRAVSNAEKMEKIEASMAKEPKSTFMERISEKSINKGRSLLNNKVADYDKALKKYNDAKLAFESGKGTELDRNLAYEELTNAHKSLIKAAETAEKLDYSLKGLSKEIPNIDPAKTDIDVKKIIDNKYIPMKDAVANKINVDKKMIYKRGFESSDDDLSRTEALSNKQFINQDLINETSNNNVIESTDNIADTSVQEKSNTTVDSEIQEKSDTSTGTNITGGNNTSYSGGRNSYNSSGNYNYTDTTSTESNNSETIDTNVSNNEMINNDVATDLGVVSDNNTYNVNYFNNYSSNENNDSKLDNISDDYMNEETDFDLESNTSDISDNINNLDKNNTTKVPTNNDSKSDVVIEDNGSNVWGSVLSGAAAIGGAALVGKVSYDAVKKSKDNNSIDDDDDRSKRRKDDDDDFNI